MAEGSDYSSDYESDFESVEDDEECYGNVSV